MTLRSGDPGPAAEVRGLIAPTALGDLLLPTAAVAEVVAYAGEAHTRKGGPEWLAGNLDWRGQQVPLIDLGADAHGGTAQGDAGPRRRHPCALICFTPSGNRALPYLAFLVADSPRLIRIRADDLTQATSLPKRLFTLHALEYRGRPAWVPDFDRIEQQWLLLAPGG